MVFASHIGWNLEVYMDNMVVKTTEDWKHFKDIKEAFASI